MRMRLACPATRRGSCLHGPGVRGRPWAAFYRPSWLGGRPNRISQGFGKLLANARLGLRMNIETIRALFISPAY